ncbi:hypothetical protein [Clostridium sp. BL-8]|uniref:hypothetical protein n=1 Tax=Clostridium sp. BL-8 TaxID=349938 RepID=UPI0015C38703|nr:hypothetical protein [Clostridium sp. BL-8]
MLINITLNFTLKEISRLKEIGFCNNNKYYEKDAVDMINSFRICSKSKSST